MASRLPSTKTIPEIAALPEEQLRADLELVQRARQGAEAERERLTASLGRVNGDLARLLQQEQLLSLVLRMRRDAANGVPGVADIIEAQAAAAPVARERTIAANVLSIVRQARGMPVRPVYVQERLADIGIEADDKVVRNALRRWAERGELIKDGFEYRAMEFRPHRP